jgi:uncharacterized membrane protein
MGLGTSLFLIAVGAILRFAVTTTAKGLNIHSVGIILIIVGAVGLVISLFWMTVWADRRRNTVAGADPRERAVVRDPEAY